MIRYIASLLVGLTFVSAAPAEDEFTSLPTSDGTGTLDMKTKSYSGYLDVTDTKSLHYVYVESQGDPTTDPVLIWFNGGPGCSSLLGLFQEHGPFVIDDF